MKNFDKHRGNLTSAFYAFCSQYNNCLTNGCPIYRSNGDCRDNWERLEAEPGPDEVADPKLGHCYGKCVKCGMTITNGVQHRKWCHPKSGPAPLSTEATLKVELLAALKTVAKMCGERDQMSCATCRNDLYCATHKRIKELEAIHDKW